MILDPRSKQSLLSDEEILDVLEAFKEAEEYEMGNVDDEIDSFFPEF